MISIYTRTNNVFSKEYFKWLGRKIINKKSGPEAVFSSLIRGLDKLNVIYEINPKQPKYDTVHVLSGVKALKNGIKLKKIGKIKKLIVGPNLVIIPNDHDKILHNENIDAILVPSKWVANFYQGYFSEKQAKKIAVWPAGTEIPAKESSSVKKEIIILFIKDVDKGLTENIQGFLKNEKLPFEIIKYGKYKHNRFLSLLEKSKLMIYLQEVESQGMALQEAWARDVPTLVLEKNTYTYPDGKIAHGQVSAPYLTKENGLFFKDFEDFKLKLKYLIQNTKSLSPKKYCLENLSDEISARKYIDIINLIKNERDN